MLNGPVWVALLCCKAGLDGEIMHILAVSLPSAWWRSAADVEDAVFEAKIYFYLQDLKGQTDKQG